VKFNTNSTLIAALVLLSSVTPLAAQGNSQNAKPARVQEKQEAKRAQQRARLSEQAQRQRIAEQERRNIEYQRALNLRTREIQRQTAQLQQQQRNEQYRVQQRYLANLQRQQAQLRAARNYNNDPYYSTANSYRYTRGGRTYETNQYGAEALKRALNYGYEQGVRAGDADRRDGYRSASYQSSYAYQDANYGYDGRYISQADFNYYFRQGFQRGWEDGYNARKQYGSYNNSTASILTSIVSTILGLQNIQ
jgi:hypothetical protein